LFLYFGLIGVKCAYSGEYWVGMFMIDQKRGCRLADFALEECK